MLPKAAVVCVLLALFSVGSQGNKEADVDNHHLAVWKELVLRFGGWHSSQPAVFRRDSGTCLPGSDEYYRKRAELSCDGEYIRAVFSEIETSNCSNVVYNDTGFFSGCGTNHNGALCGSIPFSKYDVVYENCSTVNFIFTDCSSECQSELRQLSNDVGCCIHDDFATSMPSLWTDCNIQQPEVCADTLNIAGILAKRNVDPCTEKCSLRQFLYVICKHLDERQAQLNRECGMEDRVSLCGFHKGEFCNEIDSPDSYFETIADKCFLEGSNVLKDGVCSTNCRNVLEDFIGRVGCCINYFNGSFYELIAGSAISLADQVLSSDLFAACDVEVPGACRIFDSTALPDDFLECAGRTINNKVTITNDSKVNDTINTSGAALRSGLNSIGLIIVGLTYCFWILS